MEEKRGHFKVLEILKPFIAHLGRITRGWHDRPLDKIKANRRWRTVTIAPLVVVVRIPCVADPQCRIGTYPVILEVAQIGIGVNCRIHIG